MREEKNTAIQIYDYCEPEQQVSSQTEKVVEQTKNTVINFKVQYLLHILPCSPHYLPGKSWEKTQVFSDICFILAQMPTWLNDVSAHPA